MQFHPQNLDSLLIHKDFTMEKYRSLLNEDEEIKNTQWRFGVPPNYAVVNKLFEEERTNVISLSLFDFWLQISYFCT